MIFSPKGEEPYKSCIFISRDPTFRAKHDRYHAAVKPLPCKGRRMFAPNELLYSQWFRVPPFDSSDLIRQHSLALIGRLTNPKQQRIWSLIPYLPTLCKTKTTPIGADLGQGIFQFCSDSEEGLKSVLDNRPYHFALWMVILQRWEPTVSDHFPSEIPFLEPNPTSPH